MGTDVPVMIAGASDSPGSEHSVPLFGGRARPRGVDGEGEARFSHHLQGLVGEGEVTGEVVVVLLGAATVVPDVMRGPGAELVATGGQLPNEVVQVLVVRTAAGFGPQDGNGDVGDLLPVQSR